MALADSLLIAISAAVNREGGDQHDIADLTAIWEKVEADGHGRAARLRYEAAHPHCCCANGPDEIEPGRCRRCRGVPMTGTPYKLTTEDAASPVDAGGAALTKPERTHT